MAEGAPICRWVTPTGVLVDVMPPDPTLLGFSNPWYPLGLSHSETRELPTGLMIRVFPVGVFLASKIEAFRDRGRNDWYPATTWKTS